MVVLQELWGCLKMPSIKETMKVVGRLLEDVTGVPYRLGNQAGARPEGEYISLALLS